MLRREAETLPSLLGSMAEDAPALRHGSDTLTFAELGERAARLIERCRERLASFKVPRRVIALDALPVTESANGRKVRRAELRRRAAQELQPTTTE